MSTGYPKAIENSYKDVAKDLSNIYKIYIYS